MSSGDRAARGPSAQEVAARLRARPGEILSGEDVTGRAAVAAVLRERVRPRASRDATGDLEVLLIRRAERPGDPWSGHMAFPGGRYEPTDADLVTTAVRETEEELGVALGRHGALLGRLDDVPAYARGQRTGMVVTPFVWLLHETPALSPNHEVDEVHWASVPLLMSGEVDTTIDYPWGAQTLKLPGYRVGERIVWGLTHRMLSLLFERLREG
jgi:8-oxo-dGTP pyrophosphatase MutT (NUDIX family)